VVDLQHGAAAFVHDLDSGRPRRGPHATHERPHQGRLSSLQNELLVTTAVTPSTTNPLVNAICHHQIGTDHHQRYNSGQMDTAAAALIGFWTASSPLVNETSKQRFREALALLCGERGTTAVYRLVAPRSAGHLGPVRVWRS
jgi:hypothetical protein